MFEHGMIVGTPAVIAFLEQHGVTPASLVHKHLTGDWGDLCKEDVQANKDAIAYGARVFSSYVVAAEKVYVITEANRSSTTVLLASEY